MISQYLLVDHNMGYGGPPNWSQTVEGKPNMGVEILWIPCISSIKTVIQCHIYTMFCSSWLKKLFVLLTIS